MTVLSITIDNNYRISPINNLKPIYYKHNSFYVKYNPFSLLATSVMLFYQNVISPQFFSNCTYYRSCSNFSKKAINEFGLIKGMFLSADRLLRCNLAALEDIPQSSFSADGYAIDEPEKYRINKKK